MKNDLISREAAMDCCFKPQVRPNEEIFNALKMAIRSEISTVPSILAVPLDELCLLLHDIVGAPCYTQYGEDVCNQLIGDSCNTEWNDEECWKQLLTKWMEGSDGNKKSV